MERSRDPRQQRGPRSIPDSACSALSSSRTRITAPRRDHHGEPLGRATIQRPVTDQNSDNASWISTSTEIDGISLVKTLRSRHTTSKKALQAGTAAIVGSLRSKQFDRYSEETSREDGASQSSESTKTLGSRGNNNSVPFRVKPRATKSVLYDTVDPKQYRDRRKTDPVQLYHQYQAYWKANQIPGENPHHELRWNIRALLMEKDYQVPLPTRFQRPATPDNYPDYKEAFSAAHRATSVASAEVYSDICSTNEEEDTDNWTPPPPPARRPPVRKLHRLVYNWS